jgi:tryptophan-rich sensory protein
MIQNNFSKKSQPYLQNTLTHTPINIPINAPINTPINAPPINFQETLPNLPIMQKDNNQFNNQDNNQNNNQKNQIKRLNRYHKYKEYESTLTPPDKVFQIVWAFLYITYLISLITSRNELGPYISLWIGLGLNLFWIIAFMFTNTPTLPLFILTAMIIAAVDSIFRLFNANLRVQGVFTSIYLGWLVFAFYLNYVITIKYFKIFP